MLPSSSEMLVVFGVALLFFGPQKLPALGSAIGKSIFNFKKGLNEVKGEKDDSAKPSA